MNKSNLLEILSDSKPIEKADADWFKEVINTYPYFTGAAFALTKYYNQNQDFQFQQQLKITATLASDRKALYNFVNVGTENILENKVSIEPKSQIIIDSKPSVNEIIYEENLVHEVITVDEIEQVTISEPISEQATTEFVEPVNEEILEDKIEQNNEEHVKATVESPTELVHIESIIIEPEIHVSHEISNEKGINVSEFVHEANIGFADISSIVASEFENNTVEHILLQPKIEYHESDDIELSHDEIEVKKETNYTSFINVTEVLLDGATNKEHHAISEKSIPINSNLENEKTIPFTDLKTAVEIAPSENNVDLNIITYAIEKTVNIDEMTTPQFSASISKNDELSFTEWLHQRKFNETEIKNIESDKDLAKDNNAAPIQKVEKAKAVEILDKFIETQPRISKPKVEFYSPINMARQSVADTDELATETLATIYMSQANYAKALKVYETLMLKNPDKKAHFAGLIKKTKDKMQPKKS